MNFGDRSKLACVAHPRLPSSKFDHVALGQILGDAWSCSCVLAATSSELHLFRVNLSRHAGGEGSLVPLCRVSVFAQISGIACIPHPTSKPQGSPRADNFIVLLRNGFLGLYQYDCRCNRLQACCWTPTISGLEEHDYAVCLAINATGKVAVVSKYGQVFAAELGVPLGSQPKSLALNNSVEFSALIMTRELDFMSSTQMFSKYYSVKCARWGEYTLCAGSVGDKPRSGVEALWIHGTCDVDQTEAYLTCSYFPFWYLEAPRALSIEVMLGFAFPLPPPFQNKLVFADSSNRLRLGEPSMSRRIEVEDLQNDLPSSSGAGKWILESTTTGQLVSFHGQLFRDESTLIDATVGTPEGAGGFQSDAPLMMVTSDGELFVGDVMNCEMHCCKSPFEMNFANVTSVLPLTDDLSALICLIDSGEVQLLTREDGDVDMSVAAEGQAAQLQKGVRSYSVMWASQFGVGKLIDATAIQRRNSVTMLTIHEGVNDSFQQESLEDKGACGKPSLLTWAPDPVPDVLFEGMAGEAENITSMWALQNDRGHDAAIILSSSSGTRVLEADITGIFVDVTDDIVELDCAAETLAAGNIQTNNATGWAAQVTAQAVIGFKPFDRSKVTGNKWLIPENFHVGAATVTGGMVVMHVLIHGYNHLLLLRMSVSISMESGSIGDNAEQGSHASWIVMCDMALDDEASCISNAVATGCHFFLAIGTYKPSILLIKANCDSSSCSADLIDEFLCSNTKTDDQLATLGPKGSAIMSTGRQSSDGKEDKDLVLEIPAAIILQPSPPA